MPNSWHRSVIGSPSSRRATKRRRSSITELAFHGIYTSRPPGSEKCYPCVRYEMSPMSRVAQINDLALNSLKQKKNVRLFKKSHVRHPQTGSCDLDPFAPRGDRKKSSHCRNHSQGEGVHCLHAAVPQGSRRALPRSPNLAPCPRGTGEAQNYSEDKSQDC